MPASSRRWSSDAAPSGRTAINRLPEPMRPRGSTPSAEQRTSVSGYGARLSMSTSMSTSAAAASSSRAVATPPSVTSCMATARPLSAAIRASGRIVRRSTKPAPDSMTAGLTAFELSRPANSDAMMAVPSTPGRLVSRMRSPGRVSRFFRRRSGAVPPNSAPETTGRRTASLISVCPPTKRMPSSAAVDCISRKTSRIT